MELQAKHGAEEWKALKPLIHKLPKSLVLLSWSSNKITFVNYKCIKMHLNTHTNFSRGSTLCPYGKGLQYSLHSHPLLRPSSRSFKIEHNYCLISTSYLVGLFHIFILLVHVLHIWQNYVCFDDFLPMRTLRDAYHKVFESH